MAGGELGKPPARLALGAAGVTQQEWEPPGGPQAEAGGRHGAALGTAEEEGCPHAQAPRDAGCPRPSDAQWDATGHGPTRPTGPSPRASTALPPGTEQGAGGGRGGPGVEESWEPRRDERCLDEEEEFDPAEAERRRAREKFAYIIPEEEGYGPAPSRRPGPQGHAGARW